MVYKEQARGWIWSLICCQISISIALFNSCFNLEVKMSISCSPYTSSVTKLNTDDQKPTKVACCQFFTPWRCKEEQEEQEQTSPLLPDDSLESRDGQQPCQRFFCCCYNSYINRIYYAVSLLLDHPAANGEQRALSECNDQIQHDKGVKSQIIWKINSVNMKMSWQVEPASDCSS